MIEEALQLQLPPALDPTTMAASQTVSQQLSTSEWLGPLAPVALSPFFGLAVLSGISTYGPDWLQQRSTLFQAGGLNSPWLFWTMATLAVLTSLPRLTKVSKPISLAAEKLEAFSAIIILVAVRIFGSQLQVNPTSEQQAGELMLSAGFGSVSLNVMMSVFSALNVFVVNMVKLFCEFLVWLIPVPTIDAFVELCNKAACGALFGLYCYSPWLATIVNLSLLALCLVAFLWVYRRVHYYKDLIAGRALAWLLPSWFGQRGSSFQAFVENCDVRMPKYFPVTVTLENGRYRVVGYRWFNRFQWLLSDSGRSDGQSSGLICQRLHLHDDQGKKYTISFRKWVSGDHMFQASHSDEVISRSGNSLA